MHIRKYEMAVVLLSIVLGVGVNISAGESALGKVKPKNLTGIEKEIADLLGQCRDSGSFASTGMTLLNAMANKKLKGIDVPLAKRRLYRLRYKVVALREEAPELTKSDLLIYKNTLTDPSMKRLFDLMKDADPEKHKFDLVRYDRVSRGYTFVVCGSGDIFAFTLRPSEAGIFGASIYVVTPKATLAIRDLTVLIGNQSPTDWQSKLTVKEVTCDLRGNALRITHKMDLGGEFDVVATVRPNGQTIRIDIESPKGVSDMFIGPTDLAPKEIHLGGQTIKEPKGMTLKPGDAKLTERFVGVDFGNSLSLVQASEKAAPLSLIVEPDKKTCALHTGSTGTLWLAPTSRGVGHAVAQWRAAAAQKK